MRTRRSKGPKRADVLFDVGLIEPSVAADAPKFDPRQYLFPSSLLAFNDLARHRVWQWGRGSSKTTTGQYWLFEMALAVPDCAVIFMTTTSIRAKAVAWPDFVRWNRDYELGGRTNGTELTITFPNGSRLFCTGADRMELFDRRRGIKRVLAIHLSESQDWASEVLEYAVTKVFAPRLGDLEATTGLKGRMLLEGTGTRKRGYFYRAASGVVDDKGNALEFGRAAKLTQWHNPHIADPDGEFREACKLGGIECIDLTVPVVEPGARPRWVDTTDEMTRREWFAENNDGSSTLQIFKLTSLSLIARRLVPTRRVHVLLSVDLGTVDACAVAGLVWHDHDPNIYQVYSKQAYGLAGDDQVRIAREAGVELCARYGVDVDDLNVVMDGGGIGLALLKMFRKAKGFTEAESALKIDKVPNIRLMASALKAGTLRVCDDEEEFLAELKTPEWHPDHMGERIRGHMPDRVDAAYMGFRRARELHDYSPPPPPKTPRQLIEERIQAGLREAKRRRSVSDADIVTEKV